MKRMSKENRDSGEVKSRLLTVSQVADLLNVHPNTVRHWNNTGLIKACRFGIRGDRRFKPEEIDKLIRTSQL